ncbi:MAG: hypothetical protein PHZ00_02790 [Candidatus Peribacteraceae bacterium]|nr:hypothetical protein [Candidatus Peribacteraceae bacterium]
MGIEHIKHRWNYRMSVSVGLVLSAMVVTLSALIGRGAINLKSSLLADEPTDVTVIATVEPRLEESVTISAINFLRKEPQKEDERPLYDYYVETSAGRPYFVRLRFDASIGKWTLLTFETLHPENAMPTIP